jgi:hypothetical protein
MAYLIIAVSILLRFAPHFPDFSPVYASLLFSGAVLRRQRSIWFPLLVIMSSDLLFTPVVYHVQIGRGQIITWIAFGATAMCGWLLRGNIRLSRLAGAALAGPTAFFLIANFGVWLTGHMYPHTASGLMLCYVAALPFYGHAIASTCSCGALILALYAIWIKASHKSASLQQA